MKQKQIEDKEVHRVILKVNPIAKYGEDFIGEERISMR